MFFCLFASHSFFGISDQKMHDEIFDKRIVVIELLLIKLQFFMENVLNGLAVIK